MKMKWIATVAALAAGGAYAQSSVTLYGILDIGLEYQNNQPGSGSGVTRLTSGNLSGSRWGLRGVEDLGGGLKGIFVLESGFNLDTGTSAQSGRLFGRNAYVGLQSQWGTLTLGRQQTPLYDFGLQFDPMGISTNYSIIGQDAGFTSRADNSVKYAGTFGGLTARALYSFGSNTGGGSFGEVPGSPKIGQEYSAGLTYAVGPFAVGGIYDETNLGLAATGALTGAKIRRASLAGSYAFGPAKMYAGYRWAMALDGATLPGNLGANNVSNLYWLGVGYQLLPALSLTGAAYYQDFRGTKADPWSFVASVDYNLSKRTDAYLNLGYTKNKDGSNLGLTAGGAGAIQGTGFGTVSGSDNQFGAVVGIRHKF
ncbi:membrane protein [Cupriavidus sp. SK-3]|uniref:porin n=1 Tax=Cupriavidus TaxID=106589 RepID=UPI00044AED0A|nr:MULTISPECIES: porin [Cupriavidus]KDP86509.1 membrane protein [Cupriavidus sp. SK-3]MDF3883517.1 porin [Cupriavidus basilensis]